MKINYTNNPKPHWYIYKTKKGIWNVQMTHMDYGFGMQRKSFEDAVRYVTGFKAK